ARCGCRGGGHVITREHDPDDGALAPPARRRRSMSGHSKWSTIKHKKAAKDAKRGKIFTKLIKEITVAARLGGGDVKANPRLRTAVLAARAQSMPGDAIDRAIKKGTGELEGVSYAGGTDEGYGAGGVAVMIEALTDNRNRTVADIRSIFDKHGGNLASAGSVAWMFSKRGLITVERAGVDEDAVMEAALEAGADDVTEAGGLPGGLTAPRKFEAGEGAAGRAEMAAAAARGAVKPPASHAV